MTTSRTALLDACVLVPMPLADTLLRLAAAGVFARKWSREILQEVSRTLLGKFGLTLAQVSRREAALQRHFADAWVDGHQGLIPSMTNHDGDRHVLAAAVYSCAGIIVTANLRHFPAGALAASGVEARSPGAFLLDLHRDQPQAVMVCLIDQAAVIGTSVAYLLDRIEVNAPELVAGLRQSRRF